jgi:hypothetical protein
VGTLLLSLTLEPFLFCRIGFGFSSFVLFLTPVFSAC